MLDLRQTPQYEKFMKSIGWIVERKSGVNYFIKKFLPIGSFIKIQRPEKIDYQYINVLAKKYRAFQIVIEPKSKNQELRIRNYGFRLSKTPFVPAKTIHIDLTKSEKKLLKEMHYKTRYNIRKSQNSLLITHNSRDISSFADFWQECALKQRGMFLSQKKEIIELYYAFGRNAHIIHVCKKIMPKSHPEFTSGSKVLNRFQSNNTKLLSGILMICTNNTAYYMYAASSAEGKKLFAPTLCAWESIKLAKNKGCKIYDFEGIYDERFPLKSWKGFTRFKKSFGGKEVIYPGVFVKYRFPI